MLKISNIYKLLSHANTYKVLSKTFATKTDKVSEMLEKLESKKVPIYNYEKECGGAELAVECRRLKLEKEGCIKNNI